MIASAFWNQDFPTMLVGVAVASSCAVVGCFLVLRRLSLLGDAISHGVLPGIALAFLLTGQVTGLAMVAGAMLFGILTAALSESVHRYTATPEDASLGVVFTGLFAVGILLLNYATHRGTDGGVDLDPGCVLYGAIEFAALDQLELGGLRIPRMLPPLLAVLVVILVFVALLWKELKLATFDEGLAAAMGYRPRLLHYLLISLVAGATVASFEAVGSILVIAMLVVPPATAQLLTQRLKWLLVVAVLCGWIAAVVGYLLAAFWNTNVAGMMAVVVGAEFGLAVLFAPHRGLIPQVWRRAALTLRITREDILSQLYRREEQAERKAIFSTSQLKMGAGRTWQYLALRQLRQRGWIDAPTSDTLTLTDAGRLEAEKLVRSHRLWERFMEENAQLPLDHLHAPAEEAEHFVGPALQGELARVVQEPTDPHGRAIPGQ